MLGQGDKFAQKIVYLTKFAQKESSKQSLRKEEST